MRTLKAFIITLFGSIFTVMLLELIWYFLKGPSERTLFENMRILIPIILLTPLNVLFNDWVLKKAYLETDFDKEKLKLILKKYKAKSISITDARCEYQLPLYYSFDGKIIVEYNNEYVQISGPARFVRKLDEWQK
jgi:hypothetical protein